MRRILQRVLDRSTGRKDPFHFAQGVPKVDGERRIGVVGIVVENRLQAAAYVNEVLSAYGDVIVGRMGVPYRERNISVIALIVDGTTDEIGALTGRLGNIEGVMVKTALTSFGVSREKGR